MLALTNRVILLKGGIERKELEVQIQANGISIGYDIEGPVDAPVVTMSHSLAANRYMWWPQMNMLRDKYRILTYDTRGHGDTEVSKGPYSIAALADDVIGLLNALEINKTHFVGLSMGGMIGQLLAARHSDKLLSVSLCATSCQMGPEMEPVWDQRIKNALINGMSTLAETTIERWFTEPFLTNNKNDVERISQMIKATSNEGFASCGAAIKALDQIKDLERIMIPALILVGADDPSTPPSASEIIHKHVRNSEMHIIKSASHLLNIEQAEQFNEKLLVFLQKHDRS